MKFCAIVLELHLPQNFWHTHTHTQSDRHFPETVKSCSGLPKRVNPSKIESRKFSQANTFLYKRKIIKII